MSTKVKGDKIKESSIPLSALKPNRYNLSNNEDINEVKKAISEFKVGFTIIQNSFYSNVYITGISKVGGNIYNITGINQGVTFKSTIDINKISNPLFTDDNKIDVSGPTPDWNAQEGEAGYIENKPFYTKGDTRQIDVNGEYSIAIGEFNIGDRINVSWDLKYYNDEVFNGSASFVIQEGGEEPTQYYEGDNFYIMGGKTFEMYAYGAGDSLYGKVTVMVNGEIKTLEEKYIPDTILKTTPQTLSDTDKNQALANLGIDPVVLKYMMNPYGITIGQPIPEDLANIIYDYNTNEFLPIIKNVCYIAENSGIHQYIVYVASAYNSIFTMDPENTTFMYEYNSEHKVFLVP